MHSRTASTTVLMVPGASKQVNLQMSNLAQEYFPTAQKSRREMELTC